MTAERWQQIKAIFDSAVECDPAARAEFLRQRCGSDRELQREVESLLASDAASTNILRSPIMGATDMLAPPVHAATLLLKDRYEVERELGRGGMSVVYLARDRQLLAKRVVVKVLLDETSQDPWIRQKFQQEMEAMARIDHPGVVGVLDTGLTAEGQRFLVMQYIDGVTLRSAIEPGGMNFVRAAGVIHQIGQALAAAHEKGVWHRDLKPENIMLQRLGGEDHVKLIDFGIAGIQNSQFTGEKTKVAGSLSYMAPEQFAGSPCAASDTYALGVVAYEILTGKQPFPSSSLEHLVKERQTQCEPARQRRPELSEAAERSIRQAMSFRPEDRQTTVREFSEELYHALTGTVGVRETTRKASPSGTVEIAHVLFTDLVGYSLLPMDQQKKYLAELQEIVRDAPQFRAAEAAGDIISLPTGDGMALAFFGDPTASAQCALEVAAALKGKPHLKLRMGIHGGPVYRMADVNANANLAGGGINMAQRVMDCGDAGHILLSKSTADVLLQFSQWAPYLTDLGECTVKHGVKIHLCSLATPELGNRERPRKLGAVAKPRAKTPMVAVLAVLVAAAAAGAFWLGRGGRSFQPGQDKPSIAVLPFLDLSPEKDQAYFSDGVAEELLNALSKIPGLRVAGRTSSFQFRDAREDFSVIAKKLHVSTILEGSVRKQANRVRITTQLIKTADGFNLWSDTYERDMTDIFGVEEEIAHAVIGSLKITLLGNNAGPQSKKPNPEAYNAYLQGRYFFRQSNKASFEKSVDYFQQAIRLDPFYAPAWAALAKSFYAQADLGYIPDRDGYQKAREAGEQALQLDPNLGEAHAALGWIAMHSDWNWAFADASYKRALELDPENVTVISAAGVLSAILGRLNEAIARQRRASEIDPLNSVVYRNIGLFSYYAGRQQEAIAAINKALELAPEAAVAHSLLGQIYLALAQPQEGLAEMEREKDPELRLQGLALAYQALGRKKESDRSVTELVSKFADDPYVISEVYAFQGEKDRAFEWLEKAYAARDSGLTEIKGDPLLKNLEHDPRYAALLKEMRLPL